MVRQGREVRARFSPFSGHLVSASPIVSLFHDKLEVAGCNMHEFFFLAATDPSALL